MSENKYAVKQGFLYLSGAAARLNVHSWLAIAGMAGPVILVVTDFTAALATMNYNYIQDSISSLALTKLGYIPVIGFMAIGLLIELFAAGLLYNIRHYKRFHLAIGMLVFFGFFLLLIGAFRTDPPDTPDTVHGIIHGIAAAGSFWGFPLALLILAPSVKRDPNWAGLYRYTVISAVLGLVLALLAAVIKDWISWFGLLERMVVANMIIWVEVAGVKMFRLSLRRADAKQNIQAIDTGT